MREQNPLNELPIDKTLDITSRLAENWGKIEALMEQEGRTSKLVENINDYVNDLGAEVKLIGKLRWFVLSMNVESKRTFCSKNKGKDCLLIPLLILLYFLKIRFAWLNKFSMPQIMIFCVCKLLRLGLFASQIENTDIKDIENLIC